MTITYLTFLDNSSIRPQEHNLNGYEQLQYFNPLIFAHFLSFLCNYHLYKIRSCKLSLLQLRQSIIKHFTICTDFGTTEALFSMCLGICHQMIGETDSGSARQHFILATQIDMHNFTSAAIRLSSLE